MTCESSSTVFRRVMSPKNFCKHTQRWCERKHSPAQRTVVDSCLHLVFEDCSEEFGRTVRQLCSVCWQIRCRLHASGRAHRVDEAARERRHRGDDLPHGHQDRRRACCRAGQLPAEKVEVRSETVLVCRQTSTGSAAFVRGSDGQIRHRRRRTKTSETVRGQ